MGVRRFLRYFLIGIPIGITIIDTAGGIAKVEGISMQPTLNPDDRYPDFVFLNRWAVRSQEIHRGEIVSVISPKKPSQTLIKRVIGLPGDIISSQGYKADILRVPEGYCWLEGDHLGHSMDSNTFGPVPLGLITGKATFIVWPPTRWQYLYPSMSHHNFPLNIARVSAR